MRRRHRESARAGPRSLSIPTTCRRSAIADGAKVKLGSARGEVTLHAKAFEGVRRGVLDRRIDLAE